MMSLQVIKWFSFLLLLFQINISVAQSTFFNVNSNEQHLLNRLEIKSADTSKFLLGSLKPVDRKSGVEFVERLLNQTGSNKIDNIHNLSKVDLYNMNKLLMAGTEWMKGKPNFSSKKVPVKNFFETRANLYEVNVKDFSLVINPVIQQVQAVELGNKKRVYLNSKGLELRGMLGKKIGFYSYVTDNQEEGPRYHRTRVDSLGAVTGVGFYKRFKGTPTGDRGQDYFDYRGYITFKAAKFIDVQWGYDRNFIGHGYRSLFLQDQTAPALFLKLGTKVWKLNYQNIFMELAPTTIGNSSLGGAVLQKKYAAMHHLGIDITKDMSLGLFESIMFKRSNRFEFGYLVPVLFYRAVESGLGSGDNAMVGIDYKVNFDNHIQMYAQAALDEFNTKQLKIKSWANKIGVQAGMKYMDVAGIDNLDAQVEWNLVRPYTYSHFDSATTYTHYNQPLAHQLGANFNDLNFIVRYQPKERLSFEGRFLFVRQGYDTTKLLTRKTNGGNIFRSYLGRAGDYNQITGEGLTGKTFLLNLAGSYELKTNLYFDGTLQYRRFAKKSSRTANSLMISVGLRWNMNRRVYDY